MWLSIWLRRISQWKSEMSALSLMRFLNVNHSVRLVADQGRRFVLPNGPVFPQFGPVPGRVTAAARPVAAPAPVANRGATLIRVETELDLFSDEDLPRVESSQSTARRLFGLAQKS